MNLNELDLEYLGHDAGLARTQADWFAAGVRGDPSASFQTPRAISEQVQAALEETIVSVLENSDEVVMEMEQGNETRQDPLFVYRTKKLDQPVYDRNHPRAHILERLLAFPLDPLAGLICSNADFSSLAVQLRNPIFRARALKILRSSPGIDPFAFTDQTNIPFTATHENYMAMRRVGPLEGFALVQIENTNNSRFFFGDFARELYESAAKLYKHLRYIGNDSTEIRRQLGLPLDDPKEELDRAFENQVEAQLRAGVEVPMRSIGF